MCVLLFHHYFAGSLVGVAHAFAQRVDTAVGFVGLEEQAHRAGERVRALTAEKKIEMAMVRPNWR